MFVASELRGLTTIDGLFEVMSHLEGEVYREVGSRRTFRFEHDGKAYFAKVHFGVGWKEIIKNYLQLRAPVIDASNELRAIHRLQALDIDTLTPVAYCCKGANPAKRKSCIVTAALQNTVSLEDLVRLGPLAPLFKRALIKEVARICRVMHGNGLNHRDLYICHFHVALDQLTPPRLFVIDLHRAQVRLVTPKRWKAKDLGELLFSTHAANLGKRDILRFVRTYSGKSLRETLKDDARFWRLVETRANNLEDREGQP